jgi:DNA invertase Pin-like site-specific DNA recombinase
MNAVIYCRVSSRDQTEGTSLDSQELACRDFARAHHYTVLKTFVEQGESAKFADRTQLLELIDFCRNRKNQAQMLLVWKLDRFARNVSDHFSLKATLLKYGVRIASVTEPIDTNPEGKLMETILAGFAQFDHDIRALRTVQGMRRKLQEGIFPWKAPIGYKSPTRPGEKKTAPDLPDQPTFGLLQKAWHTFATGAYTKAEMSRLMDQWGIRTQSGQPLSPQAIDHVFGNEFYAGLVVDPWSGSRYQGQHAALVSQSDFARVQQVVNRRARTMPHHKIRSEFPLRGIVRCCGCAQYLTASFSRGRSKRYGYYHCLSPRMCREGRKSHPAQNIHGEYESFLSAIAPKAAVFPELEGAVLEVARRETTFADARRMRAKDELSRLDRKLHALIAMRTDALITDDEFRRERTAVWDRRSALEDQPQDDTLSAERLQAAMAEIVGPLVALPATWRALPTQFQRRFVQFVLPVGFIRGQIRTAELGPLFKVFGTSPEGKSTQVPLTWESSNCIWAEIQSFVGFLKDWRESQAAALDPVRTITNE